MGRRVQCATAVVLIALGIAPAAARATPPAYVRPSWLAPRHAPGTTRVGSVADDTQLDVDLILAPSHPTALASLLRDLYDTHAAKFHRFLAPGEFDREFGPSAGARNGVASWLQSQGLQANVDGFDVSVHARAGALAHAFGVTLGRYRARDGHTSYSADDTPQVLASVANDVSTIVGLDDDVVARPEVDTSPRAHPHAVATPNADGLTPCTSATNEAKFGFWTPDQVGSMYGVGTLLLAGQNGLGEKIAVFELSPHTGSDTSAYLSCFGLTNSVTTVKVDGGGSTSANGTLEANIDIEEAATQAPRASIISYEGPNTDAGLYDTYHRIVSDDTAQVISTSWGLCEPFEAQEKTGTFSALDTLFAQAAAQGQAVLAATGDSGSEDCYGADPTTTSLQVDSPADDPHVTGVGGTSLNSIGNEPVWNDCEGEPSISQCTTDLHGFTPGAAGGGLSSHFTRPAWQPAVSGGSCSLASCRAVPDVSANAGVGEVFESSGWTAVGGTSIAAPKIAGIIADIDTACTTRIGDVAPALDALQQLGVYSTALNDITSGDNDLTRTHAGKYGATAGIDLASGVGSPIAGGWSCPNITSLSATSGTSGSQMTINGIGLEKATFKFGGTAASVVSANATSATVVVPSGSGTVTVQGSDAFGTGVNTASFTYTGGSPSTTTTITSPGSSTTTSSSSTSTSTTVTSTGGSTTTTTVAAPPPPPPPNTTKYRMVGSDGGIFDFGGAPFYGSTGAVKLNQPIVGMTNDPQTGGYWFVARDGGIFSYHAPFEGSTGGAPPPAPIVGMAATPTGNGYWLVTSSGAVFPFGDAGHFGSVVAPHAPIVGIAATVDGHGYWLAGSDGSVYPFGDAPNYGSEFGVRLAKPIVGISVDIATGGYWMVASDGGIFAFHAAYFGSMGGTPLNQPIVGITTTGDGKGYWMVARDGGIFTFGDAKFRGSMGGTPLNKPIVGMAAMN